MKKFINQFIPGLIIPVIFLGIITWTLLELTINQVKISEMSGWVKFGIGLMFAGSVNWLAGMIADYMKDYGLLKR